MERLVGNYSATALNNAQNQAIETSKGAMGFTVCLMRVSLDGSKVPAVERFRIAVLDWPQALGKVFSKYGNRMEIVCMCIDPHDDLPYLTQGSPVTSTKKVGGF